MADGICSVEGCDHFGRLKRGWCQMHYHRWRRYGDLGSAVSLFHETCTIEDCDKPHFGLGYCRAHYARWRRHGDPLGVGSKSHPGPQSRQWTGDAATYHAVHQRLRMTKGPASGYACRDCHLTAREWAYDHLDQDERRGPEGLVYSVDLSHYVPLCTSCHRVLDGATWRTTVTH